MSTIASRALLGGRRLALAHLQRGLLVAEAHEPLQIGAAHRLEVGRQATQLAQVGEAAVAVGHRQAGQVVVVLRRDQVAEALERHLGRRPHEPGEPLPERQREPALLGREAGRRLVALERGEDRPPDRRATHAPEAVVRHPDERRGQHRQKRDVVVAVADQAQVGEHVGHLLLGVVAAAGGAHRLQVALAQRRLVAGGVGAGLEQHHHLPGAALAAVDELGDPPRERPGLDIAPALARPGGRRPCRSEGGRRGRRPVPRRRTRPRLRAARNGRGTRAGSSR